jgi:enoyl-CoA hydratase/carnithine racemase
VTAIAAPPVTIEVRNGIGVLMLNAPPRNEMDDAFIAALLEILEVRLPSLRPQGLIVHGSGRHFSSGADLPQLLKRFRTLPLAANLTLSVRLTEALQALAEAPFPVVAAVSGCCFGSGLELALACQVRLAARNALFCAPETSLQVMPGCGATVRLPQLVGRGAAIDLILSGRLLSAEEALRLGLVDAVLERDELLPAAGSLIRRWRGGTLHSGC